MERVLQPKLPTGNSVYQLLQIARSSEIQTLQIPLRLHQAKHQHSPANKPLNNTGSPKTTDITQGAVDPPPLVLTSKIKNSKITKFINIIIF